ncbi:hypothetical protein [Ponticaulis profundi]|uniref:Uncharacterized protein n=1 Tax=Ponticaulis profundi TaxID=2665222 RepID=A0ABW1SBW7_9PROT
MSIVYGLIINGISFVLGYCIKWCLRWISFRPERKFWRTLSAVAKGNIAIVLTTRAGLLRRSTPRVSLNEVEAYSDLRQSLERVSLQLKLISSSSPNVEEIIQNPFISLGGPISNEVTCRILEEISEQVHISFERSEAKTHKLLVGKTVYETELDAEEEVSTDYGVIIRLNSYSDTKRNCVLAMGCHGFATGAAVKEITGKAGLKKLNAKYNDESFVFVIKVTVRNRTIQKTERIYSVALK